MSRPDGPRSQLFVLLVFVLFGGFVLALVGSVAGVAIWLSTRTTPFPVAQPTPPPVTITRTDPLRPAPDKPAANFNITQVRKSVVYIKLMSNTNVPLSSGSGFLVGANGLIYTNRHVIEHPQRIASTWLLVGVPSRNNPDRLDYFKAAVVFCAQDRDLLDFAILKITAEPQYGRFSGLSLAKQAAELGAPVAAVGYPAITDVDSPILSFNKGSISAADVVIDLRHYYQTDAAVNPGNSGGPLVNEAGQVVGIVTMKKPFANNMGYTLRLSEIQDYAALRPEQVALAKPEPGPIDLRQVVGRPPDKEPPPPKVEPKQPPPNAAKGVLLAMPSKVQVPHKPAPLQGDGVTVALPCPVERCCVGGAGRFLIFHLPRERKLAVFDANEAKIVHYIPTPNTNICIAACMDKLLILDPAKKGIERWSLTTFQKEATGMVPFNELVWNTAMGSATSGPLVVGLARGTNRGPLRFVDIESFKEVWVEKGDGYTGSEGSEMTTTLRLSPDGRLGGMCWMGGTLDMEAVLLNGNTLHYNYAKVPVGPVVPGPDGKTLFTSRGLFTAELKKIGSTVAPPAARTWYVPALQGPYYVTLHEVKRGDKNGLNLQIHLMTEDRPIVKMPELDTVGSLVNAKSESIWAMDQHIFLIPDANLLAVLPASKDRLNLYPFDLEQRLAKDPDDYLFVLSQPQTTAAKGSTYTYQVEVKSRKGGVKYRLDAAPPGMVISSAGKVTWKVPANFGDREATVLLLIGDKSGQEILHKFTVAVPQEGAAAVAARPEEVQPAPSNPSATEPLPELSVAPLHEEHEELALSSPAADACVGGGGRYLIFHLPRERKLAIFDTRAAKIVKHLPLVADRIAFAACADKLIVVLPDVNVIQRYSLTTWEREVTVPLSGDLSNVQVLMGAGSRGPLLLLCEKRPYFLDPYTFQVLRDIKLENFLYRNPSSFVWRMSGDGRLLTTYQTNATPQNHCVFQRQGNDFKAFRVEGEVAGLMAPGAEGRFVYGAHGLLTSEGKPVGKQGSKTDGRRFCLPAAESEAFFLRIDAPRFPDGDPQAPGRLYLHLAGDDRELAELKGVEVPTGLNTWGREPFSTDKRVFLIPSAQLLVVLSPSLDRLRLYRVDLDKNLAKAEHNYLAVLSRPPESAVRGKSFTYNLTVKARKGDVKVTLESGPDGMKVTEDGRLTWEVPKNFAANDVQILLLIRDGSGQEKFHSFRLSISD